MIVTIYKCHIDTRLPGSDVVLFSRYVKGPWLEPRLRVAFPDEKRRTAPSLWEELCVIICRTSTRKGGARWGGVGALVCDPGSAISGVLEMS